VSAGSLDYRPTVDRGWLERAAQTDPLTHAYALWDLDRAPDRIRFFSAYEGGRPTGYLLVWLGHPRAPIVHWIGEGPAMAGLTEFLPPRPLVVIVPEAAKDVVRRARGPGREYGLVPMLRPRGTSAAPARPSHGIRVLDRPDLALISDWAHRQDDPVVAGYPFLDPAVDRIWGAFDGAELVGAVHAAIRLPRIWVLGGVYIDAAARGRGWGRALVETAIAAAEVAGAEVGLYVREDRDRAIALYEKLGFRSAGHRYWFDLDAGLSP
jgi:ribosomal protein S18 acetylase RimI-like enzyme